MAEAVAELDAAWVQDEPHSASSSKSFFGGALALSPASPEEEALVAEVNRIRGAGGCDFRRIMGVNSGEAWDMTAIQSRYRHIMRLLHPDKRSKGGEARAGGPEACDEAIGLVQVALESAKREIGISADLDPTANLQQGMRRMQEVQRARARQAAQLQQQRQQKNDIGSLAADLDRALAGGAPPVDPRAGSAQEDRKAKQIVDLLAQLGRR